MDSQSKKPELTVKGAVFTGHVNTKGEKIYYSLRHNKEGEERKSFFVLRTGPRKSYLPKQYLIKNNLSFLMGTLNVDKDDTTMHEADPGRV